MLSWDVHEASDLEHAFEVGITEPVDGLYVVSNTDGAVYRISRVQ